MSDVIFSMSYVVFPMSDVEFSMPFVARKPCLAFSGKTLTFLS